MKVITDDKVNSVKFIDDVLDTLSHVNGWGSTISKYVQDSKDLEIHVHDEDGAKLERNYTLKDYRGYAGFCNIHLFATRYETEESLKWVLLHEISHWIGKQEFANCCLLNLISQKHYLDIGIYKGESPYYYQEKHWGEEYRKDEVHENDPCEVMCNMFATYILGAEYDRKWWRENIRKVDASEL